MKPLTLACSLLPAAIAAVVACGPSGPPKTDFLYCQAGKDGCPADSAVSGKKTSGSGDTGATPSDPSPSKPPSNTTSPPPAPTPSGNDAGATGNDAGSSPPATLGPSCTQLKGCCDAMTAVGVFADFCNEAVATGNESTCADKYQSYITDPENTVCF